MGVDIFFSEILSYLHFKNIIWVRQCLTVFHILNLKKNFLLFSYFCCLVAARRPCQGRVPWELIWYRVGIVNWFGLTPFWNLRTRQFKTGCHLDEVHEDISKALHIVPPTLLDPKVSVDRRIASRPRQVLVFSEIWNNLEKHQSATILITEDFTCRVCAGVSVRPDTSWQAQSQWCTQGFPFCPNPWKLIIFYSFIILQFSRTYMRKLSGLMSLWMKFLLWMYSILEINWSANSNTVFRLNLLQSQR